MARAYQARGMKGRTDGTGLGVGVRRPPPRRKPRGRPLCEEESVGCLVSVGALSTSGEQEVSQS